MSPRIAGGGEHKLPSPSLLDISAISRDKHPYSTKYKAVISGKILEIYKFSHDIWLNRQIINDPLPLTETQMIDILLGYDEDKKSKDDPIKKIVSEKRRVMRAKTKMRRLIQSNFDTVGKLLTLTFRDTPAFDITSLTVCNTKKPTFITSYGINTPVVSLWLCLNFNYVGLYIIT